ncbi:MAG: sugar phosphate isomerase/epimerase [Acidobacteriaceae bacterium]|nr:sugar phosphate isomerase/epimerase [Acidobacteriaceae bacterium]
MLYGLSTHLVLPQRLSPALLNSLASTGVQQIEVFAARHHFDYTDRLAVREIANWFRSNEMAASLHTPLYPPDESQEWSRHAAPSLNLISTSKNDRIDAMDEVKRALEAAEQIPFRYAVLHLGLGDETWNTRAIDDSLTALEHLKAFAGPLGTQLLLENLNNAVATPAHLLEIVKVGHLDSIGFCLDLGHAHLMEPIPETSHSPGQSGIAQAFSLFGDRLRELHIHDNHGMRDEHLWPGEGEIDWSEVAKLSAAAKQPLVGVLEISHDFGHNLDAATDNVRTALDKLNAS